jgi:hypothetical protein
MRIGLLSPDWRLIIEPAQERRAVPVEYRPKPIPTTGVKLSPDIHELTELLAKNAHEIWAERRLTEGWRYGQHRDDAAKEHPCLVPYEDLPESEKEYDRIMAIKTLRTIMALGYRIEKP